MADGPVIAERGSARRLRVDLILVMVGAFVRDRFGGEGLCTEAAESGGSGGF
jgi:hypothetical protein